MPTPKENQELKNKISKTKDFDTLQELKLELIINLLNKGNNQSLEICDEVIKDTEQKAQYAHYYHKAISLKAKGIALNYRDESTEEKVLQLSEKIKNIKHPKLTANDKFDVEFNLLFFYKAQKKHEKALAIAKTLFDNYYNHINNSKKANYHLLLGEIYSRKAYKDMAVEEYNKVLALLEPTDNTTNKANVFFLLGAILFDEKKYQEAIVKFNVALEIELSSEGRNIPKAQIYCLIAQSYSNLNQTDKVEYYFNKAMEYGKKAENREFLWILIAEKIDMLNNAGEYEAAIETGKE